MSYDVELEDSNGDTVILEHSHSEGGTYVLGGTKLARLNITYNYSEYYYRTMGDQGLRGLNGKTASETLPLLMSAINTLGREQSSNYWERTEGNAGYALSILLGFAIQYPQGIWSVCH